MLKLKRYSFSGIGRFVEKQTVDLESRDHLIQIDGHNQNTGGSSGAGKSTTVEALAFLLGISDIPSTQLQSRITKSPIWVQAEFEGGITITRSKKDGLTIESPGETVSGNSKLAEEKLDEIIGVDRKLLKTMCYKRQKQGGFFLNLTPKQSHEFLVQCLDLKEFQEKVLKLEENIKNKYKPDRIKLDSAINVLVESVIQLDQLEKEKKEPIKPEVIDINEKTTFIQVATQKLEQDEKVYNEMAANLGPKPVEPEAPTFEKDAILQEKINSISTLKQKMHDNNVTKEVAVEQAASAIVKINEKIKDGNRIKQKMIEVKENIDTAKKHLEHFTSGNCPTCLRAWDNEDSQTKKKQLEERIANSEDVFKTYQAEIEKVPHYTMMLEKAESILEQKRAIKPNETEEILLSQLQEEVRLLQNEKDNIQGVAKQKYLEELNEYNSKFEIFDTQYKNTKMKIKDEIARAQYEIDMAHLKKNSYEEALATYKKDVDNIKLKRDKAHQEVGRLKTELDEIDRSILLSEESIRLIKDFTLQKFQDTLDYIGQRATEIINQIPNMANAVIYFENAKETKTTGKIKNEVNAVINLEGDSAIPIKTLSGGERTSADFAIDLAVGEMIESMTQKGVNFLIIDEGFDGLDSISKIQCLEILKGLNTDKKILMVDHSSEVKEMVCDIIRVNRINEESFIQ